MHKKQVSMRSVIMSILVAFSVFSALTLGYFTRLNAATPPKILFGIGTEAVDAINTPIVKESPTKMLTSWYNGPNDLNWMDDSWHTSFVADSYNKGYTHHIVTYSNDAETTFNTSFGSACGRQYPTSSQFVTDIEKLAGIYKGNGPVYFTLNTEFQDYSCQNNQWSGSENYFNALKANYITVMQKIRQVNPNAKVSLGWGGWQTRFDNPSTGSGRSLFAKFDDVMKQSQFQSFQSMQGDSNVSDIREMTKVLGAYGPVMLAHYKPDNGSQTTFENDVRAILTESYLQEMSGYGLFAISFMDKNNMSASANIYSFIKDAITKFGSTSAVSSTAAPTTTVTATKTPSPTPVVTKSPSPTTVATSTAAPSGTYNGYKGEYFNNKTLSGSPAVVRDDASIQFDWGGSAPMSGIPADNFSARWTKQQSFEAAKYKFSTYSDDGIRLFVDNEIVIDQWNDHGATTHTGEKTLSAGTHSIRLEYYESGGGAVAKLAFAKVAATTAPSSTPAPTTSSQNTVKIWAAGVPAGGVYPSLRLVIGGNAVATFTNIQGNPSTRTFQTLSYNSPTSLTGAVKVEYINDGVVNGEDRNVMIDKIQAYNTMYESESSSVYSVGSWNQAASCNGGYKSSEWLHCNGYFQY